MSNNDTIENAIYENMENEKMMAECRAKYDASIAPPPIDNDDDDDQETFLDKLHEVMLEAVMYAIGLSVCAVFVTFCLGLCITMALGIIKLIQWWAIV